MPLEDCSVFTSITLQEWARKSEKKTLEPAKNTSQAETYTYKHKGRTLDKTLYHLRTIIKDYSQSFI